MFGTIFRSVGTKRYIFISTVSSRKYSDRTRQPYPNSCFLILHSRETDSDIITVTGAMYVSVLFIGINNCGTVQPVIATERPVFYRERAAGMYSALPYAMAQVIYH